MGNVSKYNPYWSSTASIFFEVWFPSMINLVELNKNVTVKETSDLRNRNKVYAKFMYVDNII